MTKNTFGSLSYWGYKDGWHHTVPFLRKDKDIAWEFEPNAVGWFCWAYPANDQDFEAFVDTLPSAQATHRFNGGDCMYTVLIKDKNDADKFARKFGIYL